MASDAAILRVMGGLLFLAILVTAVVLSLGLRKSADTSTDYERRRLYFAAVVLMGLGVTFFAAMSMYFFADQTRLDAGRKIFETCVSVIPPVVTLVLGYYFGRSESGRQAQAAAPPNPALQQPGDSSARP